MGHIIIPSVQTVWNLERRLQLDSQVQLVHPAAFCLTSDIIFQQFFRSLPFTYEEGSRSSGQMGGGRLVIYSRPLELPPTRRRKQCFCLHDVACFTLSTFPLACCEYFSAALSHGSPVSNMLMTAGPQAECPHSEGSGANRTFVLSDQKLHFKTC